MAPAGALESVKTINIGGKNHPSADGMIDRAHRGSGDREYYIVGNEMKIVGLPSPENNMTTFVWAKVLMRESHTGETHSYEEIGDANKDNCNGPVGLHTPRMASTRAMSRALAIALNIADVVAEEIAAGGTGQQAVQQQYNQQSGGYQAAPQQNGAPPANAGANPLAAQFPGAKEWQFNIPGGQKKDLKVWDPQVTVEDLNYWLSRGFFTKDANGHYTVPNPEKTAIFHAAIALKQGGHVGQVQQPVQQQQYAPQTQQQNQYQPPAYGQQPPQGQPPLQPQQGGWKATQQDIMALMELGKAAGRNWPLVKQLSQDTFAVPEPINLDRESFNMLRMQLGGQPI